MRRPMLVLMLALTVLASAPAPALAQIDSTPAPSLRPTIPGLPSGGPTYTIESRGALGGLNHRPEVLRPSRPTDSLLTPRYELAPAPPQQYSAPLMTPRPSRPGRWQ